MKSPAMARSSVGQMLLGFDDAAALLDETLQQESATDESLTALADAAANEKAQGAAAA